MVEISLSASVLIKEERPLFVTLLQWKSSACCGAGFVLFWCFITYKTIECWANTVSEEQNRIDWSLFLALLITHFLLSFHSPLVVKRLLLNTFALLSLFFLPFALNKWVLEKRAAAVEGVLETDALVSLLACLFFPESPSLHAFLLLPIMPQERQLESRVSLWHFSAERERATAVLHTVYSFKCRH